MQELTEAFFAKCKDAKPSNRCYLSLYVITPYYGGPEEGGWWGQDVNLVAYQTYATSEEAMAAMGTVKELAEDLSVQAKREYGNHCLQQTEWLNARGLDDDFLPEPDGEVTYSVQVEGRPGDGECCGTRHYE